VVHVLACYDVSLLHCLNRIFVSFISLEPTYTHVPEGTFSQRDAEDNISELAFKFLALFRIDHFYFNCH
jgi:hypothetical protein